MTKLHVLRTKTQLDQFKIYLQDKEYISVDTETTGVDYDSKIIGFSVCADLEEAFYIVTRYWDVASKTLIELPILEKSKEIIEALQGKKLIGHNAIFDAQMINNNYGVDLMPHFYCDTMVLSHLLDENRRKGLKELGADLFGEDSKEEQRLMQASVKANGGVLTKKLYELYKGDSELIGKYGAQDTILTLKLFYHFIPQLFEQKLDKFFFEDESMPLLRGPTYQLNTTGLRVNHIKLQQLRGELEVSMFETEEFINREIKVYVKDRYEGNKPKKAFNIGSGQQIAWLLYFKLGNQFNTLTKGGKDLCKELKLKTPYTAAAKNDFKQYCIEHKGQVYKDATYNYKTKKMSKPKKIEDPWKYIAVDKGTLAKLSVKYKFVEKLLEYKKMDKLLKTYVIGIQDKMKYNIIRPSFLQTGTTSGRYSSKKPNFQNLPRDDKRIKAIIEARPGRIFVGADADQLEPRTFASVSQDEKLMSCFASGDDFYSVVGAPIFNLNGISLKKNDPDGFAKKHSKSRNITKQFALATPYGTSAFQQSTKLGLSQEECQDIMDKYFAAYPRVELMMLESHEQAKANGVVYSSFGRPRRIPEAKDINQIYGNVPHGELPYQARTLLNLAMNHRVQSTAASIMNRAAIAVYNKLIELSLTDWSIVMQVHDEIIIECLEKDAKLVASALKDAMENTVTLPGVKLTTTPNIAYNLADLK